MVSLAQEIQAAVQRNEAQLAKTIAVPTPSFDADAQERLQHFANWCRARGVKPLPACPSTCAAFLKDFSHSSPESILATLADIGLLHNQANLADPCASIQVRSVLEEILKIDDPRSWSKSERRLFFALPIEVRAVLERRISLDSKAVRKALSERDAARFELEQLKQKGVE